MPPVTTTLDVAGADHQVGDLDRADRRRADLVDRVRRNSFGSPAPIAAWRAGAWPAPACSTWPMMTYCDLVGSMPVALEPGADRDRAELGRLVLREAAAEPAERRPNRGDDDASLSLRSHGRRVPRRSPEPATPATPHLLRPANVSVT